MGKSKLHAIIATGNRHVNRNFQCSFINFMEGSLVGNAFCSIIYLVVPNLIWFDKINSGLTHFFNIPNILQKFHKHA